MKKKILMTFVLLCLIMSFPNLTASANQSSSVPEEDTVSSEYLIPLLEALKNKDYKSMYGLYVEQPVTDKNNEFFEAFFTEWDERSWTSYKKMGEKKRERKGPAPSASVYYYVVTCGNEEVDVIFSISDTTGKIDGMQLGYAEQQVTGTLDTWRQFSFMQWLFTGIAALEFILSLYAAYLCMKRKTRLWGFWLLFILLFYAGISFPTKGDLIVSFYIHLLAFPKILASQDWGMKVYISFPIGAVTYMAYAKRKKDFWK